MGGDQDSFIDESFQIIEKAEPITPTQPTPQKKRDIIEQAVSKEAAATDREKTDKLTLYFEKEQISKQKTHILTPGKSIKTEKVKERIHELLLHYRLDADKMSEFESMKS